MAIYLLNYESSESMRRKGATVYMYSFEYEDIGDAIRVQLKQEGHESPAHAEDLVYVMGVAKGTFTEKDKVIQRIYGGMHMYKFFSADYVSQPILIPLSIITYNFSNVR